MGALKRESAPATKSEREHGREMKQQNESVWENKTREREHVRERQ